MRVKCVVECYNLTTGKYYDVITSRSLPMHGYLIIKRDDDTLGQCPKKYFITIDEHREKLINQLLETT